MSTPSRTAPGAPRGWGRASPSDSLPCACTAGPACTWQGGESLHSYATSGALITSMLIRTAVPGRSPQISSSWRSMGSPEPHKTELWRQLSLPKGRDGAEDVSRWLWMGARWSKDHVAFKRHSTKGQGSVMGPHRSG